MPARRLTCRAGIALARHRLVAKTGLLEQEQTRSQGDEKTGLEILRRALSAPARQIAENSAVDGGFDAAQNRYVDQIDAGIIDPTKVVRVALENAVSVASILLLTRRR